eukprot:11454218-Prorocentrum_lima.AAC.1
MAQQAASYLATHQWKAPEHISPLSWQSYLTAGVLQYDTSLICNLESCSAVRKLKTRESPGTGKATTDIAN